MFLSLRTARAELLGRPLAHFPLLAAVLAATLVGACSSTPTRFQSRQGLTGGTETMRPTPPASVYAAPPAEGRRSDDPYGNAVYRGGRDPVSGKAPAPTSSGQPIGPQSSYQAAPRSEGVRAATVRPQVAGRTVVEVGDGDTLYGLSTKYRVSMASIMSANGLKDPTLAPGQKLLIPAR